VDSSTFFRGVLCCIVLITHIHTFIFLASWILFDIFSSITGGTVSGIYKEGI